MHTEHVSHSGPSCVLEASLSQCPLTLRDMSSNQKSSPVAEWKFWNGVRWWGEFCGSEWVSRSPEINKSDGWTSGVTGSAGVSTGDPDGGAGILEQGQCDGGTVKTGDGSAGYARLDEGVHVEEVGGSEVGGAESAGVSAVDPDGGAGTLVQGHSDDGRVKNCAASSQR